MSETRYKPCGAETCCFTGDKQYVEALVDRVNKLEVALEVMNTPHANHIPDLDCTVDELLRTEWNPKTQLTQEILNEKRNKR